MSCKICGNSSCEAWMHSSETQERFAKVEAMSEREMILRIIELENEMQALTDDMAGESI